MIRKVAVVGSGNVAWSLAPAIDGLPGYAVTSVYGRNIEKAQEISSLLDDAVATDNIFQAIAYTDIVVFAVKDDAIPALVETISSGLSKESTASSLWLHTAGGVDASVLSPLSSRYGVLYPLQTFTRGKTLQFSDIPLFIEGSDDEALVEIESVARSLSASVNTADSLHRKKMHVAAVLACNFTNHLWTLAQDLLEADGLDFNLLRPLISECWDKALTVGPRNGQTGPAIRGDHSVMDAHMRLLSDSDTQLYRLLSQRIYNYYHNEQN